MFDQTETIQHHTTRNTPPIIKMRDVNLWYGDSHALKDVSFDLYPQEILAFIGPSGCGKSTALKCLNRMHDETPGVRITGSIRMAGDDIQSRQIDPPVYRRRFGWVAQKPNPFPTTIYENVAYGPRIHGLISTRPDMDAHVQSCLQRAHLWDEVKDDLHRKSGTELSGGQQQRLCVARALGTCPDILLMDEPTSSIDPIATQKIEDLLVTLREDHAVVIVTHSMMQARRIADRVAYFHLGELVEIGPTHTLFEAPRDPRVASFIQGKFG